MPLEGDIAGLTEEVPEAVETLRCPTCLTILRDGREKRCPACHSRMRPIVLGENARISARPLTLVERELEARIEAETAARFGQRRRAAKVARRIAALPPTLFQGDAAVEPETEPWIPQPTQASPIIVDLPETAVREVTSRSDVDHPTEPVVEQTATSDEPAPVDQITKAKRLDDTPVAVEVEVEAGPPTDAVEAAPVVEPVVDPAPIATTSWERPNSVWIDRVFSSAQRVGRTETVTWPRGWTPVAPIIDLAADSIADEIGEAEG